MGGFCVFHHKTTFGARWAERQRDTCPGSPGGGRAGGAAGGPARPGRAAALSSASSDYGNGDTFSWTEVRAAPCSRHSPIRASLGNEFSASSYMTHPRRPIGSAGYEESHSNHCCQQLLGRAGNVWGCCGWFLKTHLAGVLAVSYLLIVLLMLLVLLVSHAAQRLLWAYLN